MKCRRAIKGRKIWVDNDDEHLLRPPSLEVNLIRNGEVIASQITTAIQNWKYNFECLPIWNNNEKYIYSIDETQVPDNYIKSIDGHNIINTLNAFSFVFHKTSEQTGISLQGAEFGLRQNNVVIKTSISDENGYVTFSNVLPGTYQLFESRPPEGYEENPLVYTVEITDDGIITIEGMPAEDFAIENTPLTDIFLRRATAVSETYSVAPNSWPLHGNSGSDLYMLDKILISLPPYTPISVKWAYGVQDISYFTGGGGTDITTSFRDGIQASNAQYTVYALLEGGFESVATINIDRIRDGSEQMPYLLIDFETAQSLESNIAGISDFTLYFMHQADDNLLANYEIYEQINMAGRSWTSVGTVEEDYPHNVIDGFRGSLYGNDNSIINLTLGSQDSVVPQGLFGAVIDGGKIQNLELSNCIIQSTKVSAGFSVVAQTSGGNVLFENLKFNGSVTVIAYGAGIVGISRINEGSVVIDGCETDAIINAGELGAGIISSGTITTSGSLLVSNCRTSGQVRTIGISAAGIFSQFSSSVGACSITNCVSNMNISGNSGAAGIMGAASLYGTGTAIISSCLNRGSVLGTSNIGGIVGNNYSASLDNFLLENCYNAGDITMQAVPFDCAAGGIIGRIRTWGTVRNCYNTGNINSALQSILGQQSVGGISGNYGVIENCAAICEQVSSTQFTARISADTLSASSSSLDNNLAFIDMRVLINDVQKTPLDEGSSGTDGIATTAAQFTQLTTYEDTLGWDFTNVWSLGNEGYNLPILRGIPLEWQPNV